MKINLFLKDTVSTVILINLILAAVALLKDVFMASYLGTSGQADAFLLAYFIPDTTGNNLLAAALGTACVPVFSRLYIFRETGRLKKTVTGITVYFMFVSLLLLLIAFPVKNNIIYYLGYGFNESSRALCVDLFLIMLPIMLFFPVIAIGTAVMQVYERFNIPALAPVLFNLVFLAGLIYLYIFSVPVQKGVYLLSVSVLTGTLVMLGLIWYAMRKYRIRVLGWPGFSELIRISADIREIMKIFVPYLLILLSAQAIFTVERHLASHFQEGSIAGLNYAYRMAQFPLWVFVAAVSTVAFPSMSKATGLGQAEELNGIIVKSLRMVFVVTVPLTISLFVLRVPILTILLQRGLFDTNSVMITAGILAGYSLTVIAQGIVVICLRVFLAVGGITVPLSAAMVSACLNIVLDILFVNTIGLAGLGYGAAVGALLNSLILLYMLNKKLNLNIGKQTSSLMRILAANLPILVVAELFNGLWYLMLPESGLSRWGYALAVAVVGILVYPVGLKVFKVMEAVRVND